MIRMRLIATAALLALAGPALAAAPFVDGDAAAGKAKASACIACHGANGNSANPQWPNLAGQHAKYLYEQLKHFKSGARNNAIMMGQVANLSDQDMKDIAVYFAGLEMEVGQASEEVAQRGEEIFRGGIPAKGVPACAACHGPGGAGNPGVSYPRLGGQKAQYTAATLQAYREGNRGDYPAAAIMNAIAENMSDEEIQAVSSFVSGLYIPEEGEE